MFVYIENAHNISIYKPVLRYNGNSIEELENEIRNYLDIVEKREVKLVMYDRRFGCSMRKVLKNLENTDSTDIYVKLMLNQI